MKNWIAEMNDILYGNSSRRIASKEKLITLKKMGVNEHKNAVWQFEYVNNLMWAFGRDEELLRLAFKLFFGGRFLKFIKSKSLCHEILADYQSFLKDLEQATLGDANGEEKRIMMETIDEINLNDMISDYCQMNFDLNSLNKYFKDEDEFSDIVKIHEFDV